MCTESPVENLLLQPAQESAKQTRTLFSLRARILSSKSWRIRSCSQKMLSLTFEQEQDGMGPV